MVDQRFKVGQIISFHSPANGVEYDGVIWRILKEDETNISLLVRFVDEV